MGLFKKNWAKELDRADDLLARDLPVAALEIAERAAAGAAAELQARANGLVQRAREALVASILAKADAAEAAGDLEDAADWLSSAVEREASPARRAEWEARRQSLLASKEARAAWGGESVTVSAEIDGASQIDVDFSYEMLVSMLGDGVRALYGERPGEFRQAVVDLNEGRADAALETLERLAASAPDDAVVRLELGRARLLRGEAAAARDDFSAAWQVLGDEPLDQGGSQFVAALWAEAALAAGEPAEVVARLEELAAPESGAPEICALYAGALLTADRNGEALAYLERATTLLPRDRELTLLMARALVACGQGERAAAGLEAAVAASCGGGGCSTPAPHLPSLRFLARLHLEGGAPERARELVAHVANARGGALEAEDHEILAAYYLASGDPESAAAARRDAERLAAEESTAQAAAEVALEAESRRVL